MNIIKEFNVAVLELLSNIFGHTEKGLSGSEIHRFLLQARIDDISENDTFLAKRKRLFNAFDNYQNKYKCSNNILEFVKLVLAPSRFVNNPSEFNRLRTEVNQHLAFEGYMIREDGQIATVEKASTISDVELKAATIKVELQDRNAHAQIFKYCTPELLSNNYFHAVFEASKGLFQRIRDLSGVTTDGVALIEQVFSSNPILIINNYQSNQEKDEHNGFCHLLKGLCGMFRNPEAHQPKIYWDIEEQDALEILGLISYCHRRLDKAQQIRLA